MKLSGTERRMLAAVMAAFAAMALCFARRSANMTFPDRIARTPPAAAAPADREELVNVNTAGLDELTALPGIGRARAQAILDDRAENGPYRYPENLIRVKGIGTGILEGILDYITTGGEGDAENSGG